MKFPDGHFPEITGRNLRGEIITVRVGDRVRFRRGDGKVATDVVRTTFHAFVLLAPYAPNFSEPAAVLTEHSWTPLAHIIEVKR
jgi:hypothetical protein